MVDKYTMPRLDFESPLVATLFEIERLRADIGTGDTPRDTFLELHQLFDLVMSVVSARIEGNHTTVYDALDQIDASVGSSADQLREITNIAATARFIDSLPPEAPLTHNLIREIHRRVVDGLSREGDPTPGAYREHEVAITNSAHVPPTWVTVHPEMTSLLDFANESKPLHEQMLQIAVAHHRFVWIHPFRNGNGRVSRLFTYAMLRKTIFATRGFSALNPPPSSATTGTPTSPPLRSPMTSPTPAPSRGPNFSCVASVTISLACSNCSATRSSSTSWWARPSNHCDGTDSFPVKSMRL